MCGILGIVTKKERPFDYSSFCTLGIANDKRGGDSCGVFIDGQVEYGTDNKKLFEDFFIESKLLQNTVNCTVALGHCRKASIGTISKETAQPVVIKDGKKVKFVVIHNGTIHNYKELANKYIPSIDIKGMTDSQVMTQIFYYKGYEVLNEYNGGAVFVIVDYRGGKPKTLLFKGASKKNNYCTDIIEERPLYISIDKEYEELTFSSIFTNLYALRYYTEVLSLTPNILYEFTGTSLKEIEKYSRENCSQSKPTTAYNISYIKQYSNNFYDDIYDNYSYLSVNMESNIYKLNNKNCHGVLYVSNYGYVYNSPLVSTSSVWFFNGVALKGYSCFKFLEELQKKLKLSIEDFSNKFENIIRHLSIDGVYCINNVWVEAIFPNKRRVFDGKLTYLSNSCIVTIKNGKKLITSYGMGYIPIADRINKDTDINFKAVKEVCKSLMK